MPAPGKVELQPEDSPHQIEICGNQDEREKAGTGRMPKSEAEAKLDGPHDELVSVFVNAQLKGCKAQKVKFPKRDSSLNTSAQFLEKAFICFNCSEPDEQMNRNDPTSLTGLSTTSIGEGGHLRQGMAFFSP